MQDKCFMNFPYILNGVQLVTLQTVNFEIITCKNMNKNKEDQEERNALFEHS